MLYIELSTDSSCLLVDDHLEMGVSSSFFFSLFSSSVLADQEQKISGLQRFLYARTCSISVEILNGTSNSAW